jgi:transcriptional regulator with XRE-family HTH domain
MFKTNTQIIQGLADRSRALRKANKLSQQELADRSGVSHGSLKRFESTGKISVESLVRIMATLGRLNEVEELLRPKNTPNSIDDLFK